MGPEEATTITTDRRVLRGRRNRDAVVTALIELIEEGDLTPTAAQIADRAGVSLRTLYHHFDDLDGLSEAVADKHFSTLPDLLVPIPTDGPIETRIKTFVDRRSALFERVMPVYRASVIAAPGNPALAAQISFGHQYLRTELAETFAHELRGTKSWKLEAISAMASIDGWVRLRTVQGLTVRRAKRVLTRAIETILTAE